jgi:hypothetical protein
MLYARRNGETVQGCTVVAVTVTIYAKMRQAFTKNEMAANSPHVCHLANSKRPTYGDITNTSGVEEMSLPNSKTPIPGGTPIKTVVKIYHSP